VPRQQGVQLIAVSALHGAMMLTGTSTTWPSVGLKPRPTTPVSGTAPRWGNYRSKGHRWVLLRDQRLMPLWDRQYPANLGRTGIRWGV